MSIKILKISLTLILLLICRVHGQFEEYTNELWLENYLPSWSIFREKQLLPAIPKKYIITGAPGAGKTTVIRALEIYHNELTIREAATDVIALKQAEGMAKPWEAPNFHDPIMDHMVRSIQRLNILGGKRMFLDRSFIDIYAYLEKNPLYTAPENLDAETLKVQEDASYCKTVFLIELLNTHESTEIRHENLAEAQLLERLIEKHYKKQGFNVHRIPAGSLGDVNYRVKLILDFIEEKGL